MCKPNDRIFTAVTDLVSVKAAIEELEAEETALTEEIKQYMGDEETMLCGNNKITYKTVTTSRIDTTSLKKVLGDEMLAPFMKTVTTRRFSLC